MKNPYFENKVLCKEFHQNESGDLSSESPEIKWKSAKDMTKHSIKPEGRGSTRGQRESSAGVLTYEGAGDLEVIKGDSDQIPCGTIWFLVQEEEERRGEEGRRKREEEEEEDWKVLVKGG